MADDASNKSGRGAFDPSKTRLFYSPGPALPKPTARKQPPPLPAARQDWSKTRVLPIELLVPALGRRAAERPASLERTQQLQRPERPRTLPLISRQRVYAWAVCIVLWVSVAAASGMPSAEPTGASARERAVTIHSAVPLAERPRPRQPAPATHANAPDAPPPPAATRPRSAPDKAPSVSPRPATPNLPRVSARSAVEALAAGDTLGAANLYAALSKQHPENAAYARAARILLQRVQAQHAESP